MVYIESRAFTARLHRLAGTAALDVLNSIQADLIKNPERGDLVQGLGGIRKARSSNPARGKGKRGGFRYLFLYLEDWNQIHLLYLLDKDEQEDLSTDERKALRAWVGEIKRSRGGQQIQ
ncbi:MAG: type II toxin-antitoxin system RelE/ParE family toxin [Candidatus Sulfotelmatobacter sp.]